MLKVKSHLVVLILLSLWNGCFATARRRKGRDVPESCKRESVRVSECRASFFTEIDMMSKAKSYQHTNCTLYSKLECCMVTEYVSLGCADMDVINRAIAFAVKDFPTYENCPKGLCDPASVNGSFRIMRDMDENLHGRDAVSGLVISSHRRRRTVKRVASMEPARPEVSSEVSKSYVEEHLKGPKHRGKKKGHKRGHKGKRSKKPKLTADDLPKSAVSPDHEKGDVGAQDAAEKAHDDELTKAVSPAGEVGHKAEQNISSSASALEGSPNTTDVAKKSEAAAVSVPPAAAEAANGTGTSASGLENAAVTGKAAGLDGLPELKVPISIEVVKNISLSDIGKTAKKSHRRRRHHKNKQLKVDATKGVEGLRKEHERGAQTLLPNLDSSTGGDAAFAADANQSSRAKPNNEPPELGTPEASDHGRENPNAKDNIVNSSSISSKNTSSADASHQPALEEAGVTEAKPDSAKKLSADETGGSPPASSDAVDNRTKVDKPLMNQGSEASARNELATNESEKLKEADKTLSDPNQTAGAESPKLEAKLDTPATPVNEAVTTMVQEANLDDTHTETLSPLSEKKEVRDNANLDDNHTETLSPLSEKKQVLDNANLDDKHTETLSPLSEKKEVRDNANLDDNHTETLSPLSEKKQVRDNANLDDKHTETLIPLSEKKEVRDNANLDDNHTETLSPLSEKKQVLDNANLDDKHTETLSPLSEKKEVRDNANLDDNHTETLSPLSEKKQVLDNANLHDKHTETLSPLSEKKQVQDNANLDDKHTDTLSPLSEKKQVRDNANLDDKHTETLSPLSEKKQVRDNLPKQSKSKLVSEINAPDTKLESNTTTGSALTEKSLNSSESSPLSPDGLHNTDKSTNHSSLEKEAKSKASPEKAEPKNKVNDVPEISLAVHRLGKKRELSSGVNAFAHKSHGRGSADKTNQTKEPETKNETENHEGIVSAGTSHDQALNATISGELPAPAKGHSDNKTEALSETAVNLKDPKQIFGSGPLIEVKGNKGGSVEKHVVHAYEREESVENVKGKNSLIDDLVDQYGPGSSDYDFRYGKEMKRKHKPRFRDGNDAPKVRRRQWDGDEPFEVDTTKDPFQEFPGMKDGDPRTGGLYVAERRHRRPADESVKIARQKTVPRRKPENDYNYESVVRWKLLKELDSILDPKDYPEAETLNKPSEPEFEHEKDDDMYQWKRRLEPFKVQVEEQLGEHILGSGGDSYRDAEAMRDGEMYYRKYRRRGPVVYGQGYEGVERPIVKDPLIHQAKKRFWIERQESDAGNRPAHGAEDTHSAVDIHLRPLPGSPGHDAGGAEAAERSIGFAQESVPAEAAHRAISAEGRASQFRLGGKRLANRRAARARRLRGSRVSRKMHKSLKDTEGLKILRNDDLQGDDDDDDDDDSDDDDDDDDDDDEKEVMAIKRSTLAVITPKGQVGRVDAAERPLMSFGERVHTIEPTRLTPKKELKPAGNIVGSAESPDCVLDTLRAHTDYCRGIYTKHQLSIEEARRTASKKTMACYKLESIKSCLSAGSYFSKCVGSNNNEFQDLQGSVMSQMRDLRCGTSVISSSFLLLLLGVAANYLLRREN